MYGRSETSTDPLALGNPSSAGRSTLKQSSNCVFPQRHRRRCLQLARKIPREWSQGKVDSPSVAFRSSAGTNVELNLAALLNRSPTLGTAPRPGLTRSHFADQTGDRSAPPPDTLSNRCRGQAGACARKTVIRPKSDACSRAEGARPGKQRLSRDGFKANPNDTRRYTEQLGQKFTALAVPFRIKNV